MTEQQKRNLMIGAAAAGAAVLMARGLRRRTNYDFAGKSVVITGGSRGLGLVLARELAHQGARLTLVARNEDELARAIEDIRTRQPFTEALAAAGDIRRRYEAERAIAQAFDRFGRVDVVINNAGAIQVGPIEHMTVGDFEDAMNTHFWGPLYTTLAAVPHMRQQGEGRIVNVSSIGGRIGVPHLVPYAASKFALSGVSESLSYELARHNILVTTVYPGLMRTGSPLNATMKGRHSEEYTWFAVSDSLPLISIDARRAAHQIIEACRRGDTELVISVQAKMAILARTLAPELFARAMSMINALLPPATGPDGDRTRLGRDSESKWAPSKLTALTYRAAADNNEM